MTLATPTLSQIALQSLEQQTPMMQQYLNVKANYPTTLLFYRMGDFYELFFEDAHIASEILGITLTHRGKTLDQPIPMAGVPFHSAHNYLARLVKAGKNVAICEQTGEVTGKAPVEREVVKIITAGTLTDDNLLATHQSSSLLSLCIHHKKIGIAVLELSSGAFKVQQLDYDPDKLQLELARLSPSEIIVDEDLVDAYISELIQQTLDCPISKRPNVDFNLKNADKTLCDQFAVSTLSGFGIDQLPFAKAAAAALIHYAKETQKTALPHIQSIQVEHNQQFIALDSVTRRNLEIIEPLFEHGTSLFDLINQCKTAMGSRLLKQTLTQPLRDTAVLELRLDAIQLLLSGHHETPLRLILQEISDIERVLGRIALGSARPRDLVQLRQAFAQLPLLRQSLGQILSHHSAELLAQLLKKLGHFDELYQFLNQAIVEQPPVLLRDGQVIAEGFDAELDELRKIKDHSGQFLIDLEQKERQTTGIHNLKISYNKVSGYFIELSKTQTEHAPAHYIRRQTLKNAERYITPELKQFEDTILSADSRVNVRERFLFEQVLNTLKHHIPQLQDMIHAISQLDLLTNFAHQARIHQWTRPSFSPEVNIKIEAGRHPVVEALSKTPFVANHTSLDAHQRLAIITGPNMGGKSTFMRQVAIISLLAYCGSFVPAQRCLLGPIDRIFTRIGSADDLSSGKSTFMVEMTETAQILHHATSQSLVLMDEVGRGTSTYDGLSLAWACVLNLSKTIKCLTLFATHYFELTELGQEPNIQNYHVTAVESNGNLVLLHKVQAGPASQSHGLQVAKLAGIPNAVLKEAQKRLKILEKHQIQTAQRTQQNDLFESSLNAESTITLPTPTPSAVEQALQQLEIDDLTPRQALEQLYQLKALLKSDVSSTERK